MNRFVALFSLLAACAAEAPDGTLSPETDPETEAGEGTGAKETRERCAGRGHYISHALPSTVTVVLQKKITQPSLLSGFSPLEM